VSRVATFVGVDVRRIARDPMLLLLVAVPLLLALVLRFTLPDLLALLPPAVDRATTALVISAIMLLMAPLTFGLVIGLMLLDERDEGILTAIAVTPVGTRRFLLLRLTVPAMWAFALATVLVPIIGLVHVPTARLTGASSLAALEAVLIALLLGGLARNKVEGMALGKVVNVIFFIGAAVAWLPAPWHWSGAIVPSYWPMRLLLSSDAPAAWFAALLIAGGVVHASALVLLLRFFERRSA
jgi:fluoroquinolone transport system permease protein